MQFSIFILAAVLRNDHHVSLLMRFERRQNALQRKQQLVVSCGARQNEIRVAMQNNGNTDTARHGVCCSELRK